MMNAASYHRYVSVACLVVSLLLAHVGIVEAQVTGWQWLNPYPQGNTLYGVDVLDSSLMVAVGDRGTIVKSTDGGTYWRVKYRISGLDTTIKGVRFVNQFVGFIWGPGGVLKTTDGGESWAATAEDILDIQRLPSGSLLALSADQTLIKTVDGRTWDPVASVDDAAAAGRLSIINDSSWIVYGARVVRTLNSGVDWDTLYNGSISSVQFTSPDTGVIAFATRIDKTTNGGGSWFNVFEFGLGGGLAGVEYSSAAHGIAYGWEALPHGGAVGVVLATADGGDTWDYSFSISDGRFNAGGLTGAYALCAGDEGLMATRSDGGSFVDQSEGDIHPISNICFGDPKTGYMLSSTPALLERGILSKTTNGGLTWNRLMTIEASPYTDLHFTDSVHGCLVWDFAPWISFTSDGGVTWNRPSLQEPVGRDIFMATPDSVWTVGDSIMFSPDGGATWVKQKDGVSLSAVYFMDSHRGVAVGSEVWQTTDAGSSWTMRLDGVSLNSVSFSGPSAGIAVGDGRVFYTADGGTSWVERTYLVAPDLSSVRMLDDGSAIAIGGYAQLSSTIDAGMSWQGLDLPTIGTPNALGIAYNNVAEYLRAFAESRPGMNPKRAFTVSASSTPTIYAAGEGGSILVAGYSPLSVKTWTGLIDTAWNTDSNWSPVGKPLPGDSVVIPGSAINQPVIEQVQQQIVIASLTVQGGARLTITNALSRFGVLADVRIYGTLEMRSPALTTIVVGGSWIVNPGGGLFKSEMTSLADLGFVPSRSTVYFTGQGTVARNFYDVVFDTTSTIRSSGSMTVEHQCSVLRDLDLRLEDTLYIQNAHPQALLGAGNILQGTIVREIDTVTTEAYRFESNHTSVTFYTDTGQVRPTTMAITTKPNTVSPEFSLRAGWNILSVPYVVSDLRKSTVFPTAISPAQWFNGGGYSAEDTLRYGAGYWLRFTAPETVSVFEEVRSTNDTALNVLTADSLSKFSYWVVRIPRPTGSGAAVDRVYEIGVGGTGLDFLGTLTLRYEDGEIPPGLAEDSLRLVRYEERLNDTIDVMSGWNMVGSLGRPITPSMISSIPPGMVTSPFFGYDGGYFIANTLQPIFGYWVKTDQDGQLILNWEPPPTLEGRIRVAPTDELPPGPPEGAGFVTDLPAEYMLEQSYPNPFNAEAVIRYALPEESRVKLTVFNTLGQTVAVLSAGIEAAGFNSLRWDGAGVSSGVYYYRLDAASVANPNRSFSRTMKMALIK
jgi:photosystem II stability/assembly factor-like uncharacterized protein